MSNKMNLSFSATDPYVEINKVLPIEKIFRGQNYVSWGEDNKYPDYLYSLYSNVSTLKSIILSCVNYVTGEEILSNNNVIISNEELDELINDIAFSYFVYGGFALNVLRNKRGDVCKLVCLDFRKVRSDEKGDVFYYSKDFNKKYVRKIETIVLPKFVKEQTNVNSSIFYYKNDKYSVYPTPIYGAAITACELEKSIDDFHLNSINNCFMGSVMVNLNNGVPTDDLISAINILSCYAPVGLYSGLTDEAPIHQHLKNNYLFLYLLSILHILISHQPPLILFLMNYIVYIFLWN